MYMMYAYEHPWESCCYCCYRRSQSVSAVRKRGRAHPAPCVRPRSVCSVFACTWIFFQATFTDSTITKHHSDTTISQVRAHWVQICSFEPVGNEPFLDRTVRLLLLLCSHSHNDVPREPQRNVSIAAVQGAVRLSNSLLPCVCVCVCVCYNSRNDVPRVAKWYGTIAAHTRRRASVLVVFVVFCVHMYSFAGLIRCRHRRRSVTLLSPMGRVAQSVGHLTRKSGVLGSIPGLATYFRFSFCFFKKGSCQSLAKVCARRTG